MSVGVRVRPKKHRLHDQYTDPLSCVADNLVFCICGQQRLSSDCVTHLKWQCQASRDAGSALPHYGPIPSAYILNVRKNITYMSVTFIIRLMHSIIQNLEVKIYVV